ncbi:IS30 family transposase [Nocardia amikacinitolerans]|uniref:IS30 family transposase n=1 Tax=Nocardia amikacinitolerans TaxID=756689 RepID=UPI0020A29E34|nr:IS30 family transposase [Nocardia amikacinitolerans]
MSVGLAAAAVGVSRKTGYKWGDQRAGIVRQPLVRAALGRSLSLAEREEIAIGVEKGWSRAEIGRRIGRDRSVVSREVARNGNKDGSYRAVSAQWRANGRVGRPRPGKLAVAGELRDAVVAGLRRRLSPQQISAWLQITYPDRPEMRVSHETIYHAVYVQAKGTLRGEVAQALRTGRGHRVPHPRVPRKARHIADKIMISERPAEVADRAVPGHWEGDLIMGRNNNSAIGTLVERSTRFVMLLHLPAVTDVVGVRDAMIETIGTLPAAMARSVTWDQGFEMRRHAEITLATGVAIYFCDPHSPWKRGTNENTNGLLRQYFPKGTDLSVHTPAHLRFVADELNDRPRQTLGWKTPAQAFTELVVASAA